MLIGVVMMALALTILGLSLFSLSSYESQFLDRSLAMDQAENRALGEIERAKFRLTTNPYRLESVGTLLADGVTADAWQIVGSDTIRTGPVSWDDDVTISVSCTVGDATRSTSGRFNFHEAPNYYKRLITTAGQVNVDTDGGTRDRTVRLVDEIYNPSRYSRVWQNDIDTSSWILPVEAYTHGIKVGGAPTPVVRGFIEQTSDPILGDFTDPDHPIYKFAPHPGDKVGYFCHIDPDSGGFSYEFHHYPTFRVTGHVVVMFRYGIHVENILKVVPGGPDASLTIVAARNRDHPPGPPAPPSVGMWLEGGINSPNVPVFLVSDGSIYLQQTSPEAQNADTRVTSLSIFAANVFLRGPYSLSTRRMRLSYDRSTDALVDSLSDYGALPNTSPSGTHRLALIRGTWQMSAR